MRGWCGKSEARSTMRFRWDLRTRVQRTSSHSYAYITGCVMENVSLVSILRTDGNVSNDYSE